MPAPTDITGLTHRFRASKLGLTDGSLISSAAFETGGITLSQGTLVNQPKYVASSINGVAGMRFNGSTSWIAGNGSTTSNQPFTISFVIRINQYDGNTTQEIMWSAACEFGLNILTSNSYMAYGGGSGISGGLPTVGAHAVTLVFDTSNATSIYVDGRLAGSGTIGTAQLNSIRFGTLNDGTRPFNGDICEFVAYNKALGASDRATLNSYIQSIYGISMADVVTPDAVTAVSGLTHRFRASKVTAFTNGASVTSAPFEVGGITLTQSTSGNAPIMSTNSVNNLAGLSFNGSSYWMDATIPSQINQAFTMTVIVKMADASGLQEIINGGTGAALYINNTPANTYAFYAGSSLYGGTTNLGVHAITIVANSAGTSYLYVDGVQVASGNPGSGAITAYSFGRNPGSGRYFNGDINEYILYNRALSPADLVNVDTYIQNTYGIRMNDVPLTTIASDTWSGANGAAWSSQWTPSQMTGNGGSGSIQSNMGAILPGTASGATFREYLSGMPVVSDIDVVVSFSMPAQNDCMIIVGFNSDNTLSSNPEYGNDPQNGYYVRLRMTGDNTYSTFEIYREIASSRNQVGGTVTQGFAAGTMYSMHIQKIGQRVRGRMWLAANTEPTVWGIDVDDPAGTQLTGKVFLAVTYNYNGTQPTSFDNMTVSGFNAAAANNASTGRYVRSKDIPSLIITASGMQNATVQSGSYTLGLSDAGKVVEMSSTSVTTVTIPPSSSVNFPIGSYVDVCQIGTGQTYVVGGAGVTLDIGQGAAIYARYGTLRLRQRATNEWVVTGPVTPFYDPTTISGLVYRMRASTLGITTDGTAVASMPFEVGGVTLTQGTASAQPLWRARGRNGKPYVNFDGVDDNIFLTSGVPTYNQPVTVCVAAQINNGLSSQELFKAGGVEILLNQSANTWSTYAGTLINSPVVYSGVQYFTAVFGAGGSQGSIQAYTNGVLTAFGGGGGNGTGGGDLYIGTHPQTARFLAADVYEILTYSATLTNADLAKLHAYMQATYL